MLISDRRRGASTRLEALPSPRRRRSTRVSADDRSPRDAAARVGHAREQPARHPSSPWPSLAGLKVLVVDDEPDTLAVFEAALTLGGAVVTTAGNAIEALRVLKELRPHVVLSDIAMPGGDGYWLIRQIHALGDAVLRSIPVIAATAYGREHPQARTLAAGFIERLQKPVDPELLCRTVAKASGR